MKTDNEYSIYVTPEGLRLIEMPERNDFLHQVGEDEFVHDEDAYFKALTLAKEKSVLIAKEDQEKIKSCIWSQCLFTSKETRIPYNVYLITVPGRFEVRENYTSGQYQDVIYELAYYVEDEVKEPKEDRENGFYWVDHHGKWIVAEWFEGDWYITGSEEGFDPSDFEAIGSKIIVNKPTTEEPKEASSISMEKHDGQYKIYGRSGVLLLTIARRARTADGKDPAKNIADWIFSRLSQPTTEDTESQNENYLDIMEMSARGFSKEAILKNFTIRRKPK